jgi:DNA polymerase-1
MRLVFDAEANGLLDTVTKMHCLVGYDITTRERTSFYTGQDDWIERSLDYLSQATYLIGHNIINYDLPMLKQLYGWVPTKGTQIVDTYIQSRTQFPDRMRPFNAVGKMGPHGLDAWGYRVGRGKPAYNEWEVFDMEMLHRCEEDVEINVLVYRELCKEGDIDPYNFWECEATWLKSLRLEHKMQHFINDMEHTGFPVNQAMMEHHITVLADMMTVIEESVLPSIPMTPKAKGVVVNKPFKKNGELSKMVTDWTEEDVGGPFSRIEWHVLNLGSEKQVKEYLLSIGWRPTQWNFKKVTQKEHDDPSSPFFKQQVGREAMDAERNKIKSGPKLTEDSFASLKSDVGKQIANYLQRRHRRSLLEGLVKLIRPDGRITQRISGITSTGRYKHAGIVNIPGTGWYGHEIRECFITAAGYKIVGTDAASCQLRMLAHYMGDPDYIKVVCDGIEEEDVTDDIKIYRGTDVHTRNGIAAGLIDPSWVAHCFGKFTHDLADDDVYNTLCYNRRLAKNFIYGLLFGAGDAKIAETLGCTIRKAKQIRATFMAGLPALKRLLDGLEKAYSKGFLFGMDRRKLFVRSPHMMLVYLLQGAEATFMKVAWCFLKLYTARAGIECETAAFVHDEFQELVREDQVEEYQDCAKRAFIQAGLFLKMKCPTAGGPKVGINWRETH